jgi:FSR family fosmidomycin resistance protein-like MFS transporter
MISRTTRVNALIGTGHFLSHFYMLILPPMFLVWQPAFHVSFAELGMTMMLMSGITAILQTPVGFLVDRYGARRFLIGGTLIMSMSVFAMGLATEFWQILALAALSGVGNSVIHPADYAILSGSVPKERMGRSFAMHSFTGNMGFAFGPPVIAVLMATLGWRSALMVVGALGLPVVAAILVQSRILNDQARKHDTGPAISGRALLMTRPMLMFFTFFLLGSMATAGLQAWVASAALTGYMVGNTAGTLVGGWFADKASRLGAITVGLTIASAALIFLTGMLPIGGVAAVALLFAAGLAYGTSRTPRDVMVKDAAPPGQIGKVF